MLRNVIFLDRDGVINRDSPDYIKSWQEFEFLPGSIDAIVELTQKDCPVMIISNQSAVGRNLMSLPELHRIFFNMNSAIEHRGGRLLDIFYCPHSPDENCSCRKPKPGLIFKARDKYNIDLASAVMVGDSLRDIECAKNAGCGHAVLVESGYEQIDLATLKQPARKPDHIAPDLRHAADWIIKHLTHPTASNDDA